MIDAIEVADIEQSQQQQCMKTFMERFLLFSFSEYRYPYSHNDCEWFYWLANQQTQFIQEETSDFWSRCASFGVFQSILSQLLSYPLKLTVELSGDHTSPVKIFDVFDRKVSLF